MKIVSQSKYSESDPVCGMMGMCEGSVLGLPQRFGGRVYKSDEKQKKEERGKMTDLLVLKPTRCIYLPR